MKISDCGMLGFELRFNCYRDEDLTYSDAFIEKINQEFLKITLDCYERAKAIVAEKLSLIRKLTPILVNRRSIEKSECEMIISQFESEV